MNPYHRTFGRGENGFSLIETMIVVAILGLIMTAAFSSFLQTMRHSSQQSNIADTRLETGTGLDLLRWDLEHAGFGLPWGFPAAPNYFESAPMADAPNNVPRAIISQDNSALSVNNSDYLVIKAANVDTSDASQRWGYVGRNAARNVTIQSMGPTPITGADRIIVIRPESSPGQYRQLRMDIANSGYSSLAIANDMDNTDFAPIASPSDPDGEKFLVYVINNGPIRRPFNRTDYYINNANVPAHCSPTTGVFVKATENQGNDQFNTLPIVDCVADFQIVYYLDTNGDGGWDQRAEADGLNGLSAQEIRDRVKMVHCYILTHEGSLDSTYTHANANINVGEVAADGVTLMAGAPFDLSQTGANWRNYRWKVYNIAITPKNLK